MSASRGRIVIRKLRGKSVPTKDRIKRWKVVTGDQVEIRFGKDKKKQGEVLKVLRKKNKLVVKGVNVTKRHKRIGMSDEQKDGYWYAESPVHYSRVALVDPSTGRGARVRWGVVDGKKERIAKKSQTVIPKPVFKYRNEKKRDVVGPKDTPAEATLQETFDPETLNPLLLASLEHKTRKLSRE